MGRKKSNQQEELLVHSIRTRINDESYQRLERILKTSNCHSIGELARRILSQEKITCYHRDTSMDAHLELLAGIEKELNSIGVNINQITRYFNSTDIPNQKIFYALKVLDDYKRVGNKVEQLLSIVSELSKKWLQR